VYNGNAVDCVDEDSVFLGCLLVNRYVVTDSVKEFASPFFRI